MKNLVAKITPILVVDRIEPSLPFWEKQLGYEKIAEVPHDGRLGFVLLQRGDGELMMQTRASIAADLPKVAARTPNVVLYLDVGSLDEALAATKGAEVLQAPRTTFYGMREASVVDPQGHVVVFAQKVGS
jgi:uncharacterized glyoxalase superfamily protein PhnB